VRSSGSTVLSAWHRDERSREEPSGPMSARAKSISQS
jgi:hypothetical protein